MGAFFVPVLFRAEFLKRYALQMPNIGDATNHGSPRLKQEQNMKDVTAHITLSRSLESDINLFRAWEADKYDFRVLDALIREFYGIYGLDATLKHLARDMPSRSVVRMRALLFIAGKTRPKAMKDAYRRLGMQRDATTEILRSCALLKERLNRETGNNPIVGQLTTGQLQKLLQITGKEKGMALTVKALYNMSKYAVSDMTLRSWDKKFKMALLQAHSFPGDREKLKGARNEIKHVRELMIEYKRHNLTHSKPPYPIYAACISLLQKYDRGAVLRDFTKWAHAAYMPTPLVIAAMISDPNDCNLNYKEFMQKYYNGVQVIAPKGYVYMGYAAKTLMSIKDPELFQLLVSCSYLYLLTVSQSYITCEMSELQLAMELQKLLAYRPDLSYGSVNAMQTKSLATYGVRKTPLDMNRDVFEIHKPDVRPYIRKYHAKDLEKTLAFLSDARQIHPIGTALRASYDAIIEDIEKIMQEIGEVSSERQDSEAFTAKTLAALGKLFGRKVVGNSIKSTGKKD